MTPLGQEPSGESDSAQTVSEELDDTQSTPDKKSRGKNILFHFKYAYLYLFLLEKI